MAAPSFLISLPPPGPCCLPEGGWHHFEVFYRTNAALLPLENDSSTVPMGGTTGRVRSPPASIPNSHPLPPRPVYETRPIPNTEALRPNYPTPNISPRLGRAPPLPRPGAVPPMVVPAVVVPPPPQAEATFHASQSQPGADGPQAPRIHIPPSQPMPPLVSRTDAETRRVDPPARPSRPAPAFADVSLPAGNSPPSRTTNGASIPPDGPSQPAPNSSRWPASPVARAPRQETPYPASHLTSSSLPAATYSQPLPALPNPVSVSQVVHPATHSSAPHASQSTPGRSTKTVHFSSPEIAVYNSSIPDESMFIWDVRENPRTLHINIQRRMRGLPCLKRPGESRFYVYFRWDMDGLVGTKYQPVFVTSYLPNLEVSSFDLMLGIYDALHRQVPPDYVQGAGEEFQTRARQASEERCMYGTFLYVDMLGKGTVFDGLTVEREHSTSTSRYIAKFVRRDVFLERMAQSLGLT